MKRQKKKKKIPYKKIRQIKEGESPVDKKLENKKLRSSGKTELRRYK